LKALKQQGIGSYVDISNKKRDPILPVPYWSWFQPVTDVAASAERETIKYARPLLKDMLEFCQCVISGVAIEIEPHIPVSRSHRQLVRQLGPHFTPSLMSFLHRKRRSPFTRQI
jgi:hypothetical protein